MKKIANSGFTLIEIIVVMIIVGILAAIALPNMFANVQRSYGTQAIAAMDAMESTVEACCAMNNVLPTSAGLGGKCPLPLNALSDSNPSIGNNNFVFQTNDPGYATGVQTSCFNVPYTCSGIVVNSSGLPSAGNMTYSILAINQDSGAVISLTRATDGSFSCSAPLDGPFAGVCQIGPQQTAQPG